MRDKIGPEIEQVIQLERILNGPSLHGIGRFYGVGDKGQG
jgi:hypothetical protein